MTSNAPFPSKAEISQAVKRIHDRPEKIAIAVTGGFAGLQQLLWATAGASRTLIDAAMPYDRAAFDSYVGRYGKPPEKYCSMEAAHALALAAFVHANELTKTQADRPRILGLGASAALATDRVRRGGDRFYVAVWGSTGILAQAEIDDADLSKLSRLAQGRYSDLVALDCLLEALMLPKLELPTFERVAAKDWEPWTLLLADGQRMPLSALHPDKHLLFPGSFNPLHDGHLKSAAAAEAQTGKQAIFLIECEHPDKGPLPDEEVGRRLRQFSWKSPLIITRGAGLYIEKAKRFPGFGFVVGADTMRRICDPRYYPRDPAFSDGSDIDRTFAAFLQLGTRFFVFDRIDGDRLRTLDDIPMPPGLRQACVRLEGRWDVSSTELRSKIPSPSRPLPL